MREMLKTMAEKLSEGEALRGAASVRILELCQDAYTILTGPTCPMCPALLELGIQRLSGLVITNRDGMREKIRTDIPGTPYPMGMPFLLTGERL